MKISLYDSYNKLAYNPNTEQSRGVGGTQSIIINSAKELAKRGHDVTVYIKCNFPDIYDGVKYYQNHDYQPSDDILIGFESLPKLRPEKTHIWSTNINVNVVKTFTDIDKLIVLSEWHRDRYATDLSSELKEKMVVVEPGVGKEFFQENVEKWNLSVAYAGHPYKGGMKSLVELAKRIKAKDKEISIHAYGSGALWGWDDDQYRSLYDDLIRHKVLYHGQGGQKRIIKQLIGTQIFLYPVGNQVQETFGLVVLQAMAAGCVVVANDNGNIKNLVGDAGYVIPGNVNDYRWQIEASDKVVKLFQNISTMEEIAKKAVEKAKGYTWEKTIDTLEKEVLS